MQLMPKTVAEVAAELGLGAPSRWALFDPGLNIALDFNYLARIQDRFGHVALTTAAYNAGPAGQARRWLIVQAVLSTLRARTRSHRR